MKHRTIMLLLDAAMKSGFRITPERGMSKRLHVEAAGIGDIRPARWRPVFFGHPEWTVEIRHCRHGEPCMKRRIERNSQSGRMTPNPIVNWASTCSGRLIRKLAITMLSPSP
jgi:hypothetical protein